MTQLNLDLDATRKLELESVIGFGGICDCALRRFACFCFVLLQELCGCFEEDFEKPRGEMEKKIAQISALWWRLHMLFDFSPTWDFVVIGGGLSKTC